MFEPYTVNVFDSMPTNYNFLLMAQGDITGANSQAFIGVSDPSFLHPIPDPYRIEDIYLYGLRPTTIVEIEQAAYGL